MKVSNMLLKQIIIDSTVEILRRSATKLPKPVMDAMVEIKNTTNDEGALLQIQNIVDDAFLAMEESKPMCQDTGIISFTIEVG
ncbi:MAG: fumarate hydratase, partial [Candidatus Heimdallarchaeota archaeon]|nr:fumarate hydratase [Candidatus Heimdallarchaeota archaeon]